MSNNDDENFLNSPSTTSQYTYTINNDILTDDLIIEFENNLSFMINLINQRLNNIENISSNQDEDEFIGNEHTSNDDDGRNNYIYNIYNNSEDVSNLLINDYSNDFYYANNNIENVLSAYIGDGVNSILENVLNLSFEEAPTISKNENQEIKLEEVIYTKIDSDETCTICLSLLENGDSIGHLDCNHKFHFDCINEWCKYKSQCPMCRYEVQIK